jgi:hypothetical protein
MLKNYSLNRMLVLVATAGFAFLLADNIIEHWSVFKEEVSSFIPVVFSAIGLIIGLVTVLKWKEKFIKVFQIVLLASIVVALAGMYFHIKEDDDEDQPKEQVVTPKEEKDKPVLAPLAYAGLAIVGLLGTSRKWHAEVDENKS